MSTSPKLITLNDFDPRDQTNPLNNILFLKNIGKETLCVFDDKVLLALIEVYQEDGEIEIVKMVDRGQVFQSQAERLLGVDRYKEVGMIVPCE